MQSILFLLDITGTIAFAISGALVAIHRSMDLFGVVVLGIVTATGGGVLRDVFIGSLPPVTFQNPAYLGLAALTALLVFGFMALHPRLPHKVTETYDLLLFTFDTLGVAAFTVDGVILGLRHGFLNNLFLLTFLGVITGVGGGVIRDILANRMPDILKKHVYALASILGALSCGLLIRLGLPQGLSTVAGFSLIVILRILAARFQWNLPRIKLQEDKPKT